MALFYAVALLVLSFLVTWSLDKKRPGLQKIPITCDADTFNGGHEAEVTCNFHRQMDQDKRGISVVRYPLTATDSELGTDILLCEWKKHKYDCWVRPNYTFNGVITDRLTVEIPSVSREFGGLYMCFIVHSEDTQKHACELRIEGVKDGKFVPSIPGGNGTDPQSPKEEVQHTWVFAVIVFGTAFPLIAIGAVIFWLYRRWKKKRHHRQKQAGSTDEEHIELLEQHSPNCPEEDITSKSESSSARHKKVETLLNVFKLSMSDLERVYKHVFWSITTTAKGITKSFSVRPMPKRTEKGQFLSVCVSREKVDIRLVTLLGPQSEIQSACFGLPAETNSEETFFLSVSDSVAAVLKSRPKKKTKKTLTVEYQKGSSHGYVVTKENNIGCVPEQNHMEDSEKEATKLQHAFRQNEITRRLQIKPTVTDPEATVLSGMYSNPACSVAFFPGVEFKAGYTADNEKQETGILIIDFEAVGDHGCLDVFISDVDRDLDIRSGNPGKNILGKMVSLEYQGEILRQMLLKLSEEDDALSAPIPHDSDLQRVGGLTARHAMLIEGDLDGYTGRTQKVLEELKLNPNDSQTVRDIFRTILERSSGLTAAILAALITIINHEGVTIAVDGVMHNNHPYFFKTVEDKARELVPQSLKSFQLLPQREGRLIGAAVAAVLSEQTTQAATKTPLPPPPRKKCRKRTHKHTHKKKNECFFE